MAKRIGLGILAVMMFCSVAWGEATYSKLDDFRIQKTEVKSSTEVNAFDIGFLKSQIESITNQRDAYVAQRNKEISECETLIAEAIKLGIKEQPKTEVVDAPVNP